MLICLQGKCYTYLYLCSNIWNLALRMYVEIGRMAHGYVNNWWNIKLIIWKIKLLPLVLLPKSYSPKISGPIEINDFILKKIWPVKMFFTLLHGRVTVN